MLSASRVNPVNYLKLQQHLLLSFLGKNLGKISSREKNFQPLLQLVWENCDSQSKKQKIEPVSYSFPQVGAAPINGPRKKNGVPVKKVERWKMVEFAPDLGTRTTRTWDCHQHLELSKSVHGENI